MKAVTEGHFYELDGFEDPKNIQVLQFIHKEPKSEGSTELKTVNDGTTNEEVLRVLIDRLKFLHGKLADTHTESAIDHCEHALHELEARTVDREMRKTEGTNQA